MSTSSTVLRAIDLSLSLMSMLSVYGVNVRQLTDEWETARAEGREVDVAAFISQAKAAQQRLEDEIAAREG